MKWSAIYRSLQRQVSPIWWRYIRTRFLRKSIRQEAVAFRITREVPKKSVRPVLVEGHAFASQWLRQAQPERIGINQRLANDVRHLFVDVSVIFHHDAGTGIQRVVRAVIIQLKRNPTPGWMVVPVVSAGKRPYCATVWPPETNRFAGEVMQARPGDIFLGLDFSLDSVVRQRAQLANFRKRGGRLWFVMYDLLPALRPVWFADAMVVRFRKWFTTLAYLADGFFCISQQTTSDLQHELASGYGLSQSDYATCLLPMVGDIAQSHSHTGMPAQGPSARALQQIVQQAYTLMVGTLEPRKGHADVLAAYERLWARGDMCSLIIVGKSGWKTEDIQNRILDSQFYGTKLHWINDATDADLVSLYNQAKGVIVASYAEGFGLPLLEALQYRKPVLARDLPVFRSHQHPMLSFFPAESDTGQMAESIHAWWMGLDGLCECFPEHFFSSWTDTVDVIFRTLQTEVR